MNINKKLCPFKWYVLENFPFIEADFDAITNWQLLCKLGEEINKIIPKVNLTGQQVEDLTNYVNNYFDNLDVQEEINNKLDEMAESGELADIIAHYIQLQGILAYNSVAEMKQATNLVSGSFAETYGYYSYGDGGNAKYKIRQVTNQDTEDDMFIIALANPNLVAELIFEEPLNVLKVGVKNDNSEDISIKLNTLTENHSLFLPAGEYKVNNTINLKHSLLGNGFSRSGNFDNTQTIINAYTDKPINISGNTERTSQNIEKINIRVIDEINDTEIIRYNPTTYTRAYIKNICIYGFKEKAINIDSSAFGTISRGIYINNATLFAKPYSKSIGIYNANNTTDNKFSNIELMYVRQGIINYSSIIIDNIHIWTGGTGTDINDWWSRTRGIINNNQIMGDNIYIDTSYLAIVNENGGKIYINNFIYYIDESISGSNRYDGTIIYSSDFYNRQHVFINNASIFTNGRIQYINGIYNNLVLSYYNIANIEHIDLPSLLGVQNLRYQIRYAQNDYIMRYLPVAILTKGNGYCELEITNHNGNNAKIKCSYKNNAIEIDNIYYNASDNYYYKEENNRIIIYLATTTIDTIINVIINATSRNLIPINMNCFENLTTKTGIGDEYILTSSSGLTQITNTQNNP